MKPLRIDQKLICHIPEKYNELSAQGCEHLCKLLGFVTDPLQLKLSMFLFYARLTPLGFNPMDDKLSPMEEKTYLFKSKDLGRVQLKNGHIMFMCDQFDFLFTTKDDKQYLDSSLYMNLFPQFKASFITKLHGPDSALYNITLAEFIRCEVLYMQMSKGQNIKIEDQFVACLYRPKDKFVNPDSPHFSGDIRQEFNDNLVEFNAKKAAQLHPWQNLYVKLFYEGCRKFIIQKHPMAFSSKKAPKSNRTTFENFTYLVAALSGDDATKAAKIRKTPLWDILPQLEMQAEKASEMEKSLKKTK